jgi:outer membrane protein TolC
LKQAIEMALSPQGSPSLQAVEQQTAVANEEIQVARSASLPTFDFAMMQQGLTRDLQVDGIQFQYPGYDFRRVGPYAVFDARLSGMMRVLDFTTPRLVKSARAGAAVAKAQTNVERAEIAYRVALAYAELQRAEAMAEARRKDIEIAESSLQTARNRDDAGRGLAIEVTRANAQLAQSRRRLVAATGERARAALALLQAMGASMISGVEVSDPLAPLPQAAATADQAVTAAMGQRAEIEEQQLETRQLESSNDAIAAERLPAVNLFADFGTIGAGIRNTTTTYTAGLSLRIPVFDGGRRATRQAVVEARIHQSQSRERDLRSRIELQARQAFESVAIAREELRAAEVGVSLSKQELDQAQRRYEAGVTGNLEVIAAQRSLATAREESITVMYGLVSAHLNLFHAMGAVPHYGM